MGENESQSSGDVQAELGLTNEQFELFNDAVVKNVLLLRSREIGGMLFYPESMGSYGSIRVEGSKLPLPLSGHNFRYDPKTGEIHAFTDETEGSKKLLQNLIKPNDQPGSFTVANKYHPKDENMVAWKITEPASLDVTNSGPQENGPTTSVARATIEQTRLRFNSENNW